MCARGSRATEDCDGQPTESDVDRRPESDPRLNTRITRRRIAKRERRAVVYAMDAPRT
jgi:hypothetical protein